MRFIQHTIRPRGAGRALFGALAVASLLGVSVAVLGVLSVDAGIKKEGGAINEKAPCQVCTIQGAGHGAEKVAAVSVYEGKTYTFCSDGCKERFDEDPLAYLPIDEPRPAPDFVVRSITGETVGLPDYHGRWLLLDFWATWCKPCVKLMPEMDELAGRYEKRGVSVLGLSIDESAEKALAYAEKQKFGYLIAVDDPKIPTWTAYHVKVVPTLFLIDPEGRIVERWMGQWDRAEVEAKLEAVLDS